ncbi:MAG: restriction endonuclease subunit S [Candidatus Accumulibacter sp.]|uniref:Restriction endonuclease subunit S n=1 Tax=Candidatus Accumulibacter proximus TaxID=2954385 RepID=A0A935UG26_9PROT|nr:restriction endonuclease subunit S [Candidatus Accumulibacter proximus]
MTYAGNCRLGDLFTSRREKGRSGLPTLSVTLNDGLVNREDLCRKQETSLAPEEHLLVKPGDIAYNMMRMWQGALGLSKTEGLVSPAYVVLKPKAGVNPQYMAYLFKTKRAKYLFWAYSYGLTEDRLRLYFDDFHKIPAFIHGLPEQEAIVAKLATWNAAIQRTERLLFIALATKRSMMQALLSPKHPADWRNHHWRRVSLGEICSIDVETLSNNTPPNYEFSYISLADVDGVAVSKSLARHKFHTAPSRARRVVKSGDILMSTVRPNLKGYARINEQHAMCIASTGFAVLSSIEGVCRDYVYHYLYTDDI